MPVDLPAQWLNQVDLKKIQEKVQDFSPFFSVVQKTWDAQTLESLREGRISVPDEAVNAALANALVGNEGISELKVTSVGDGKLKIAAQTKALGRVSLTCRIDEFRHDSKASTVQLTVLKKSLPDQKLLSLMFSHLSLAMLEKMVGSVDLGEALPAEVKGNTVTLDLKNILAASEFGQAEVYGHRLLDALVIEQANVQKGQIEFKTRLNVPESIREMFERIVK